MENHGKIQLIAERFEEPNGLSERERERGIPIKNKTRLGYLMAYPGCSVDISTRMKYHRGTVQYGISHTITTQCDVGVVIESDGN